MIPYREPEFLNLTALQDRMNRMFGEMMPWREPFVSESFWPLVDMYETPEYLEVRAELPGIKAKDIEISVAGDTLTIKGEKPELAKEKYKTFFRHEIRHGKFTRMITLPVPIEADRIEAVDEMGILTILLPKTAKAKTRRIEVKVK